MPGTEKEKIKHVSFKSASEAQTRKVEVVSDTKQGAQVNAATYTSDHGVTGLDALTKTLAGLNPSLSEWAERSQKESDTQEAGKAAADFTAGNDYTNESNTRAYEREYMKQKAIADGIKLNSELDKYAQENWQLPPDEYEAGKLALSKKYLGNAENPYYAQVFAERAQQAEAGANAKYTSLVRGDQVAQWKGNVGTEVLDVYAKYEQQIAAAPDAEAQTALRDERNRVVRAMVDEKIEAGKALGLRAPDVVQSALDATSLHMTNTGDSSGMGWTSIKGKDGIAVRENGELAKKAEEAEVKSYEVQKLKLQVDASKRHEAQGVIMRDFNAAAYEYYKTGNPESLAQAEDILRRGVSKDPKVNPSGVILEPEQLKSAELLIKGLRAGSFHTYGGDPETFSEGLRLVARGAINSKWIESRMHLLSPEQALTLVHSIERQRESTANLQIGQNMRNMEKMEGQYRIIPGQQTTMGPMKDAQANQMNADIVQDFALWKTEQYRKHGAKYIIPENDANAQLYNIYNKNVTKYGYHDLRLQGYPGMAVTQPDGTTVTPSVAAPVASPTAGTATGKKPGKQRTRVQGMISDK